jgi:hypothetical protein
MTAVIPAKAGIQSKLFLDQHAFSGYPLSTRGYDEQSTKIASISKG